MTKRKLVTIQEISAIQPIKGADRIEAVRIMGWDVIARKGEFSVGDPCLYFEVDSFLPVDDERYSFLYANSYKNSEFMGKGYRIKTQRLRGQLSQGLAFSLDLFPEVSGKTLGYDVTDILRVIKWDVPEVESGQGTVYADYPAHLSKTGELRMQSNQTLVDELAGQPYYISTKLDGTSCTFGVKDGEVFVASRNGMMKDNGTSLMWHYFHSREGLVDALANYGKDITFQGELVGPLIKKNTLQLTHLDYFVFNVVDERGERLDLHALKDLTQQFGLNHVPIEEEGDAFQHDMDTLLGKAQGKYDSGINKEGIVIRPKHTMISLVNNGPLSFKVLNNDFLLKTED